MHGLEVLAEVIYTRWLATLASLLLPLHVHVTNL